MLRQIALGTTVFTMLLTGFTAVHADESSEFTELFGSQIDQVRSTRDTSDDLELAKQLLTYLEHDLDQKIKILLIDHAFELAKGKKLGFDIAESALQSKLKLNPENEISVREDLFDLMILKLREFPKDREDLYPDILNAGIALAVAYENNAQPLEAANQYRDLLQYARRINKETLEQVTQARKKLLSKITAQKQLESVKAKFLDSPSPALALEASQILLIVFDQPEEALPFAQASEDAEWKKQVTLASTKDTEEIKTADLANLGIWYKELADNTDEANQPALYTRAIVYLSEAKERGDLQGLHTVKADLTLKKAQEALEALGGSSDGIVMAGSSSKIKANHDLMPMLRNSIQRSKRQFKRWEVRGDKLICNAMEGNSKRHGNYSNRNTELAKEVVVTFEIKPISNTGGIMVRLPAGKNRDVEIAFQANTPSRHNMDGKILAKSFVNLGKPGKAHKVAVKARFSDKSVGYQVFLNGKKVDEWSGDHNNLLKNDARLSLVYCLLLELLLSNSLMFALAESSSSLQPNKTPID